MIKSKFDKISLAQKTYSNQWIENIWNNVEELFDKANDISLALPPEQSLVIPWSQLDSLQINING